MGGKPIRPELEKKADYIKHAYQTGQSIDDLASEFSCSSTPIRNFLLAHNIPFRPAIRPCKLKPFKKEVEIMYRSGKNTYEIAEMFSVDRNTVSVFLECIGIRRNAPLSSQTFHIEGEANKGIFAGLLVGEGSIIIRGNGVAIRIANNDGKIIDWLAQWGGKVYWVKPRPPKVPNPSGIWDLAAVVDVFHCLVTILPYMIGAKHILAVRAIRRLKKNYGLEETDEFEDF